MLKSKSFLSVDFGAGSLKVGEFELNQEGNLRLLRFGIRPLGLEGSQESARERVLLKAIQELIAEKGFAAKAVSACCPGFQVFSKFVKLPPVDASKVTQIIQYEAQQNVPFPLEEVAWDYQIVGNTPSGEMEVLLVAIKSELVEGLFRTAENAGLKIQLVDASPAALANAFRYNYSDLEGCTLLLDIGAKTSNVLLFEKGKVFSRGINIGANSITQDFMAEAKIRFAEAEQFKVNEGFVSLGGAYEDPENPKQLQVSKVSRQVLTRLHIQVNQTLQFYRTQQGGSAPLRIFLAGGASIMTYADKFFEEKFNLPVEFFNPFRQVDIDPGVDREALSRVAQGFGEVVGLGLRNLAECPLELDLIPTALARRQQFSQKKPYFVATAFTLALGVFSFGLYFSKVASVKQSAVDNLSSAAAPLVSKKDQLEKEEAKIANAKKEIEALGAVLGDRLFWGDFLAALRQVMVETEVGTRQKLGVETGLWFESFTPDIPGDKVEAGAGDAGGEAGAGRSMYMDPRMAARYGLVMVKPKGAEGGEGGEGGGGEGGESKKSAANTNEISVINVVCRGINNIRIKPSANTELAFDFQSQLQTHPALKPFLDTGTNNSATKLSKELDVVTETDPTFSFGVTLKLKRPIKL